MFIALRSLAIAAAGLAALSLSTPTRRAPTLEVALSAPTSVRSVEGLKITASVTNVGSEAVKVLKYGTILDSDLPTESFVISKNGVNAKFQGIKLSVDTASLDDSAFAVIPAGETVTVTHDVSALYAFHEDGAGIWTFAPVENFQVMPADVQRKLAPSDELKVIGASVDVEITEDVAQRELQKEKRARVTCSNSSQSSFISSSFTEAKSLASIAASYISSRGASDSLYRAYFGTNSVTTVRNVFSAVANENSSSRTLSCTDTYGACSNGVIAYTLVSSGNIYYCSIFFNEVANSRLCSGTSVASRNVRSGTTLHELTHALSNTDDVGYGCSYDQSLASSSPSQALRNADNYNCFATQVYASTQC